jgi:hypothetical protein
MVLGKLNIYMHKNGIRPHSHLIHKTQLKWIKDLRMRPEAAELTDENTGKMFHTIALGNDF